MLSISIPAANIENARAFTRYFFKARVMRPVAHCDPSTKILGFKSSIPVFVSGAALAKLGHPDGVDSLYLRRILRILKIWRGVSTPETVLNDYSPYTCIQFGFKDVTFVKKKD